MQIIKHSLYNNLRIKLFYNLNIIIEFLLLIVYLIFFFFGVLLFIKNNIEFFKKISLKKV